LGFQDLLMWQGVNCPKGPLHIHQDFGTHHRHQTGEPAISSSWAVQKHNTASPLTEQRSQPIFRPTASYIIREAVEIIEHLYKLYCENAYRLSIAWPQVLPPKSTGEWPSPRNHWALFPIYVGRRRKTLNKLPTTS
jgi:hypothetical protein